MNHNHEHNNSPHKDLLQILAQCADECDHCFDMCLEDDRTDALVRALRACRDCAKICRVTASFVASGSDFAQRMTELCAEVCRKCADICENHTEEEQETMHCARICRECEEACRKYQGTNA
ncbi:four-helix bundle copper-binding protein [Pontibacter diazotrophicus]|uniref:Four-helix bundle copper-binding protein n=1 Tax=Pontibacter diazotrophicus TaxID=1400979 RepID=A0A3D8L274_9BACT|nr:four-helix bundle copper-binding protein [Pontibacter diazotrophicus]RDV11317.1 four-helix bundle copper-binding protein [Pontibacter diazotrophicus]